MLPFRAKVSYNYTMYKYFSHYSDWWAFKQIANKSKHKIMLLNSPLLISPSELKIIASELKKNNFVVYEFSDEDSNFESIVQPYSEQFGLKAIDHHLCVSEDKITKIFDDSNSSNSFYIPYTNKPINWHTDGYYNLQQQKVFSFILHCSRPAYEGGVNSLLDQDLVFIHLMESNPLYIDALMQADVMTIPENRKDGILIRPETSTAIFEVLNNSHDILMRYSLRKKNIRFKQDAMTQEALACMDEFINSDLAPSISIKLKAGQGVLCNNVLHKRTAFKDKAGSERLYYRARYYNRIKINVN